MQRDILYSKDDLVRVVDRINQDIQRGGINSSIELLEEPDSYPAVLIYEMYGRHGDQINYEYVCRQDFEELDANS